MAKKKEPLNLNGLVDAKELAVFIDSDPGTIRAWRWRRQKWITDGKPASDGIPTFFPDPVMGEDGEPFLLNGAQVWAVDDVVRLKEELEAAHERGRGNPDWGS